MIHIVIEVNDDPSWKEYTKEAVAERLTDLGSVRVVDVQTDQPEQLEMVDGNE